MTKDNLNQYIKIQREINTLKERIEKLTEKKTSLKSQVLSSVHASGTVFGFDELLVALESAIEELVKKESDLVDSLLEIEECIATLEDSTERNILRLRYIEGKKWEEICIICNYSWRQIHRLHSEILNKIA